MICYLWAFTGSACMHLRINSSPSCAEDCVRTGKQRDPTQISREGMILTLQQADPTNPAVSVSWLRYECVLFSGLLEGRFYPEWDGLICKDWKMIWRGEEIRTETAFFLVIVQWKLHRSTTNLGALLQTCVSKGRLKLNEGTSAKLNKCSQHHFLKWKVVKCMQCSFAPGYLYFLN